MEARIDRLEDTAGDHTRRIGHLEIEEMRTRDRLHRIEGDREALRLLAQSTQQLSEQTRTLASTVAKGVENVSEVAEQAAVKALEKMLERRAAKRWKVVASAVGVLAGLSTIGYLIAYLFLR